MPALEQWISTFYSSRHTLHLKKFGGTLIPSIFLKTLENNLIVTQLLSSFPKIIVNVMTNKLAAKRLRNTALEGHIQMFLLVPTFQVKYVTFPRMIKEWWKWDKQLDLLNENPKYLFYLRCGKSLLNNLFKDRWKSWNISQNVQCCKICSSTFQSNNHNQNKNLFLWIKFCIKRCLRSWCLNLHFNYILNNF